MATKQPRHSHSTDAESAKADEMLPPTVERDDDGIMRSACCNASILAVARGDERTLRTECKQCGQRC